MIEIDGSSGEGGGQILRSALTLSVITGKPFRIFHIRRKRERPGLLHQHLTAVQAAAAISQATVAEAELYSQEIRFEPSGVRPGAYQFSVGTAGSATLVLQTILLPLLLAQAQSTVVLEGGTHNPHAPPFPYLSNVLFPLLRRMGAQVEGTLERNGFYPAGGGRFTTRISPSQLQPLSLEERGSVVACRARALVSRLPRDIGERELAVVKQELEWTDLQVEDVTTSSGPGNALVLEVESENVTEVFTGFGERGVRAETVAWGAVEEARGYLEAGVPVGSRLADQLLLPLAVAGGGSFRTLAPTLHTTTNVSVLQRFLDVTVTCKEAKGAVWRVQVGRKG